MRSFYIFFIFSVSIFQHASASPNNLACKTQETNILFIGNSFSYFNNLPRMVEEIAENKFPKCTVTTKLIAYPGMGLRSHVTNKNTIAEIESGKWDFVVLQEQTLLSAGIFVNGTEIHIGSPDSFYNSARKFNKLIKRAGAKSVLFMTSVRKLHPEQQEYITNAYSHIANELHSLLAPAGLVWERMRSIPGFELYEPDGSHPSNIGSYVSATTIFSTIFQTNPINTTYRIDGNPYTRQGVRKNTNANLVTLSQSDATTIQRTVKKTINSLSSNNGYPEIKTPLSYFVPPTLIEGEFFTENDVVGRWYGKSGFNLGTSIGLKMDVSKVENNFIVELSLYTDKTIETIHADKIQISENHFSFEVKDKFNTISKVNFVKKNNQFIGLSAGKNNAIRVYDDWLLSKSSVFEGIDLKKIERKISTAKRR